MLSEEAESLGVGLTLDQGSDELGQEVGELQETGPEVVEEVENEGLDMRAVVVLVSHDHDCAVP